MNELNYAKELMLTAAILGSIAIIAAAIAAIISAIVKLLDRRDDGKDREITRLHELNGALRSRDLTLCERLSNLTNEIITVRGVSEEKDVRIKELEKENEALEAENRMLMRGTPAMHIKGRIKK